MLVKTGDCGGDEKGDEGDEGDKAEGEISSDLYRLFVCDIEKSNY